MGKHSPETIRPAEPHLPVRAETRLRRIAPLVAIVLLAFVVHFPGLMGQYTWDDNEWLIDNTAVQRWDTFFDLWVPGKTAHFFPLVTTSYWIEHKLWGLGGIDAQGVPRPVGYHVTNLLLHAWAAMLVYAIVRRMKLRSGEVGAWLAGAIFAVHPMTVETVAWVAERKNTLCAVFLFASAYFAFRTFGLYEGEQGKGRRRDSLWGMLLFLAAMLSKTTACFLPPALLVMAWWKRGRITVEDVKRSAPYFVIAVVLGGLSVVLEKQVAGTGGAAWDFTFVQRVLIAGNAFWFYVMKLFVPYPVHQVYPRWPIDAGQPVTAAWLWIGPALAIVVPALLAIFWKKLPRGPLAARLIYAGGLFPTLGFISFYTMLFSFVADHYAYLAMPAGIVFGIEALGLGMRKIAPGEAAKVARMLGGLGGALILAMGVYTYFVSGLYRDGVLLWDYAYRYNPKSSFVCTQYAVAWLEAKPRQPSYIENANTLLEQAMALNPNDWRPWHAKAQMLEELGRGEDAARFMEEARRRMEVRPVKPVP